MLRYRLYVLSEKLMVEPDDISIYDVVNELVILKSGKIYPFSDLEFLQSTGICDVEGNEIFYGNCVSSTFYDLNDKPYRKMGYVTYIDGITYILYSKDDYPDKDDIFYHPHLLFYAEDLRLEDVDFGTVMIKVLKEK